MSLLAWSAEIPWKRELLGLVLRSAGTQHLDIHQPALVPAGELVEEVFPGFRRNLPGGDVAGWPCLLLLSFLDSPGIRFRKLAGRDRSEALQRLDGARVSSMWMTRRTGRRRRAEVVALSLRLRPVDHADRPLEPRLRGAPSAAGVRRQRVSRNRSTPDVVEQRLVAARRAPVARAFARAGPSQSDAAVTVPV